MVLGQTALDIFEGMISCRTNMTDAYHNTQRVSPKKANNATFSKALQIDVNMIGTVCTDNNLSDVRFAKPHRLVITDCDPTNFP